ncbi:hypothetical protein MLD38_012207 [Melastoma candidum]|uniref:Uncharacterized protein n=1 Tax=Melastoma candidum TaxID=119954 RepID=A0ACB9R6P4_9MYRT|nr:hypothetical protein MLD38_012207 [Melastoma candidum]
MKSLTASACPSGRTSRTATSPPASTSTGSVRSSPTPSGVMGSRAPSRSLPLATSFSSPGVKQEALSSSGINMTHDGLLANAGSLQCGGGKNSADRSLHVDLMYWVSQNPPPAHLFLISGDRDFAGILHCLRMNNYNVLLASPESASGVLCSAASIMWHWNSSVRGENLAGKIYNQLPDGPYGSWYGHYKAVIEDPYAGVESSCSKSENIRETCPKQKPSTVPASVVKQIRRILSSFPQGISVTELRETEVFTPCKTSHQVIDSRDDASGNHAAVPAETNMKVVEELPGKANAKHSTDERAVDKPGVAVDQALLTPVASQGQQSASEAGLFKRVWNKWFGPRPGDVTKDNNISLSDETGMTKYRASNEEISSPSSTSEKSEGNNACNSTCPSLAALLSFDNCRFQRNDDLDNSKKLVMPSDRFCNYLPMQEQRRFGATIAEGRPADLMSLGQNELLHLTGVLISERKLIREDPSLKFPFMLMKLCSQPPHGLSSFFRSEGSPIRRSLENNVEKTEQQIQREKGESRSIEWLFLLWTNRMRIARAR